MLMNFFVDARSYCLDQNADLISFSTQKVFDHIKTRLSAERYYAWWIGLNTRDYDSHIYWSDSSPVNFLTVGVYRSYSMF